LGKQSSTKGIFGCGSVQSEQGKTACKAQINLSGNLSRKKAHKKEAKKQLELESNSNKRLKLLKPKGFKVYSTALLAAACWIIRRLYAALSLLNSR
jgi:hypothetical protein